MTVSLTRAFFSNARGITFKDGSGVTWSINKNTNEITATASGGSSSPLTTKGDVWGYSSADARIPVGSDGKVLTADSSAALGVSWQTPSASGIPASIADIAYWFEADKPVLSTGSYIFVAQNSIPWAFAYSGQVTTGNGATRSATTQNGLHVATFPGGVDGRYLLPAHGLLFTSFSGFFVMKRSAGQGGSLCCGGNSGSIEFDISGATGQILLVNSFIAVIGSSTSATPTGSFFQGNVTYDGSTGNYVFRQGRAADGSGTNPQPPIASGTAGIGWDPQVNGQDLQGDLGELILYNRALTPTEVATVEAYLLAKWGV